MNRTQEHPTRCMVLIVFFVLAKVLEFVVCRVLMRLAQRTEWLIDDESISTGMCY